MAAGDLITLNTNDLGVQYEYAGVLFGTTTRLIVEGMSGLDSLPEIASDDTDRNDDHGTLLGIDLMKGRDVTMTLDIDGLSHADVMAIYRTLARVMRPLRADVPLVFKRPGEVKKQVLVRPRKRDFPSDGDVAMGLSKGSLNWLAGDPRIYSLVENHNQIVLPAGDASGQAVVHNSGDFHGYARFVLSGDGSNPRIAVSGQTADPLDGTNWNGQTTALDIDMGAGDVLQIIPKTRNILLNGASAYHYRRNDNQWWELMPGDNTVTFDRADTTGQQTLDIYWYDVWL